MKYSIENVNLRNLMLFLEYDSFVMYSRVVSIESIHMTNAAIQNSPYPSIKNTSLMRNAIGMTFNYKQKRLFYSDIQRGSINTVFFNGSGHAVLVESKFSGISNIIISF